MKEANIFYSSFARMPQCRCVGGFQESSASHGDKVACVATRGGIQVCLLD